MDEMKLANEAPFNPEGHNVACNRYAQGTVMVSALNCSKCEYHCGIIEIAQPVYKDDVIVDAIDVMVQADELSTDLITVNRMKIPHAYKTLCNRPKQLPLAVVGNIEHGG